MRNPFHPENQKEQFEFFNQITEAVNKWMLESYPGFDTTLLRNLERCIQIQRNIERDMESIEKKLRESKNEIHDYVIKKIEKSQPALNDSIAKVIEKLNKRADELAKKTKDVLKSDTLYEDVYRLKDEIKGLVNFTDGFRKKLKQACE